MGILAREIAKTAIDTTITKQAINAIRAMDVADRGGALCTLLDSANLDVLSPVFVTLMRVVRAVYDDLEAHSKAMVDDSLVRIYDDEQHILSVELNLAYYLQALARRVTDRKVEICVEVYDRRPSPILRRIIVGAMCNWRCHYWLSDIRRHYASLHEWEKRSVILASYFLTDEGKRWRSHIKETWSPMELLIRDWFSDRWQKRQDFPV
jgi:hypothetical protein